MTIVRFIEPWLQEATTGVPDYPEFTFQIGVGPSAADDAPDLDWLALASNVTWPVITSIPRERRVLVMREPSGIFPEKYANQFGILVSPWLIPGFRGFWYQSHGGHGPWIGASLAMLRSDPIQVPVPAKKPEVSAVVSRKVSLPGHRQRLRFLRHLRVRIADRLHLYGRGFNPIVDKANAILPFQYHLVLENTAMPSYWTEKLADAYVCYAFPFVSGPPDLARWFPPESFQSIDLDDPERAVETVVRALDERIYESRIDAIRIARQHLLGKELIAPLLARVISGHSNRVRRLLASEAIAPPPRRNVVQQASRLVSQVFWKTSERLRR